LAFYVIVGLILQVQNKNDTIKIVDFPKENYDCGVILLSW